MKAPIFLFGSGRCGSTLVQRSINAHPDIIMYGEHEGFLGPVAKSYEKLTQTPDVDRFIYGEAAQPAELLRGPLKDSNVDICWINNFNREDVYREHRALVLNLLAKDIDLEKIHWGFKEIRYHKGQHTLWFLREMFPDCKFVFLVRDPIDTIISSLLAWDRSSELIQDQDKLAQVVSNRIGGWTSKYSYLLDHMEQHPEGACVIKYEELVVAPKRHMREVFGLLDLDCPQLALDMFKHRVASTLTYPDRENLTVLVKRFHDQVDNNEYRQLSRKLQYA